MKNFENICNQKKFCILQYYIKYNLMLIISTLQLVIRPRSFYSRFQSSMINFHDEPPNQIQLKILGRPFDFFLALLKVFL